jgi:hypothetical protein
MRINSNRFERFGSAANAGLQDLKLYTIPLTLGGAVDGKF